MFQCFQAILQVIRELIVEQLMSLTSNNKPNTTDMVSIATVKVSRHLPKLGFHCSVCYSCQGFPTQAGVSLFSLLQLSGLSCPSWGFTVQFVIVVRAFLSNLVVTILLQNNCSLEGRDRQYHQYYSKSDMTSC